MGGRKVWTQETLAVPDMQEFLQDQVVMRFPTASARAAAIPDPENGMVTWLDDDGGGAGSLETYEDGWRVSGTAGWPKAQLRQTASQTGLTANQYVDLVFQTEDLDTHGGHSTISNANRWTCPGGQGGLYALEALVSFGSIGAGVATFLARYVKNGANLPGGLNGFALSYGPTIPVVRRLVELNPGDWVGVVATVGVANWQLAADENTIGSILTVERVG